MSTEEMLVAEARRRYKDGDFITPLQGCFLDYHDSTRTLSDPHYRFYAGNKADIPFHYDEKADTLCNWGRGMGLIYRKGEWAAIGGKFVPESTLKTEIYQIY